MPSAGGRPHYHENDCDASTNDIIGKDPEYRAVRAKKYQLLSRTSASVGARTRGTLHIILNFSKQ